MPSRLRATVIVACAMLAPLASFVQATTRMESAPSTLRRSSSPDPRALSSDASSDASLPDFETVRRSHRPSDVVVVDRHGEPLQSLRIDASARRLAWISLDDVSPALLKAVVLGEDRDFERHRGVDWRAVAAGAWASAWRQPSRGASTLSMQLVALLDDSLARPSGGRGLALKIAQMRAALSLEARWSKAQILEAYVNLVPWRGETIGIDAMSQTLFRKHPGGLDARESAVAAALLRAPQAKAPVVARRACAILALQQRECRHLALDVEAAFRRPAASTLQVALAPHWARYVWAQVRSQVEARGVDPDRREARSEAATWANVAQTHTRIDPPLASEDPETMRRRLLSAPTSIDGELQRFALAALQRRLAELGGRRVEDGAVVVLDNASGEVLAWVGSSGERSQAREVDAVLARRQPGSTLKPFAYELAFERRLLTAASLLEDAPARIATGGGLYVPRNYDEGYRGWVSARTALASSLNIPAVRVGEMLGPDALFERLNRFGMTLSESGGYHGQALVLGSADVSLLNLTNAYRALANGGRRSAWRSWAGDTSPVVFEPVAEAGAVAIVTDILSDNVARASTFGLDSVLATSGFAAVKTGTSKDLRDNWCVGFTDRYTVGVWVGNASGAPMHVVSGTSGAAPLWRDLVQHLHASGVSRRPPVPSGVERREIRYEPLVEPRRAEWFLTGTAQSVFTLARTSTVVSSRVAGGMSSAQGRDRAERPFGIVEPKDGSIIALDPDIPPHAQRLRFEGEPGTWRLDGVTIGEGPRMHWLPSPGRHRLELLDRQGRVRAAVSFDVRGATWRPTAGRRQAS